MLIQPLLDKLSQLHLPAFHDGLQEQINNPQYASLAFEERLALLVDQECTNRHQRQIERRVKQAGFPQPACVEDLDLSPSRGLDRRFVLELAQSIWISSHLNAIVSGPTGAGKTFLISSLGLSACRSGYSVRYFRTSRLLHALTQARLDASYPNLLRSLARTDLLILDDWMRDALTPANAQDILEVLDDRYDHAATIVASQIPLTDWFSRIPDPTLADAILDRLVHNAYRLQLTGDSQRKLRAKRSMPNS